MAAFVCALPASAADGALLFHNGRIALNDSKGTVAHALLARHGRVVAVGELADLARRPEAANAERIDLGGGFAVPGLQDGHVDLELLALSQSGVNLAQTRSYGELIERVQAASRGQKDGTWIIGWGWDERSWSEPSLPHHLLLSASLPRHPVFLLRRDGRAALLNQAALALAQLDGPLTLDPRKLGGRIVEDEDGRATGVLVDGALELVRGILPAPDPRDFATRVAALQQQFFARGVTAVHDMGTRAPTLDALRDLRTQSDLKLRVIAYLDGNASFETLTNTELPRGDADERLTVGGVRFRLDGALVLHDAALLEPYASASDERGQLLLPDEVLVSRLSQVVRRGLQPVFETQGDRASRVALDLLDRVAAVEGDLIGLRPRLESVICVATKDWPRFPALGVVSSMQPAVLRADFESYADALGEARWRGIAAWRALVPALGRAVFGSGAPEQGFDPLATLAAARLPLTTPGSGGAEVLPGNVLAGSDALGACTSGAAWACRQEQRRGRLQPGFAADLSVFSGDLVTATPDGLGALRPRLTVINGEIVWRAR